MTAAATSARLSAVRVVGGLLPNDVVTAVLAGTVGGLRSNDYHLGSETPREAAARAWTHLLATYRRFRDDLATLPAGDPAVALTRERWLSQVLADLGYGRVPATPAGGLSVGEGAAAKSYPVSHLWGRTPIHQLGWGVPLDTRSAGVAGAARAPHAMLQELLNRTDDYLWAILTNGRTLRLLRDSTTLTGFAYVEFDLETMFDGELFSEFALLYLLVHQSRVEVADDAAPSSCWLERWRTTAIGQGVRALTLLRDGVETALETLGTGFLQHPANSALRGKIADGTVRLADVHAALLRTVYRLLFWAVAEDRDALLAPDATAEQRTRYQGYYSSARLRDLALKRHGSGHDDLWQSATFVLDALGRSGGEPRLGLPGLGGLFSTTAADVLADCRLPNTALLSAVRSLSVVQPKGEPRRTVDFAHLGAEELGSVYESLLELVPRYDPVSHAFSLETLAGNDRKTSGSYYTPSELVELVLDTALDPVLDDVEKRTRTPEERAEALVELKVCDPAVGSAHFLVAAARRIALRLAVARTGELDPTPTDYSDALHDVVGSCLYGVDINPMAADLAKVSLWLTAMTPGKPLSFLDHHIKVGNALLGATPALLRDGVPDAAFTALTGDDKSEVTRWKKANKAERANRGGDDLFSDTAADLDPTHARTITTEVDRALRTATSLDEVTFAAQRYATLEGDAETQRHRLAADAWCAAFLGDKTPTSVPITTAVVDAIAAGTADETIINAVHAIAARHRLFHWHLEFPEVFRIPGDGPAGDTYGWTGGFSASLGNPPWERVKLQEQEFFATRADDIANARNAAARKKAIAALEDSERHALFVEFNDAKRRSEAESHFLRTSGRYPLTGVGDVNTYQVFAEHFRASLSTHGRSGVITPTGLATDATTAPFFADTLAKGRLVAFLDFVTGPEVWSGIGHNRFRFAISCMTGGERSVEAKLSFYKRHPREVAVPGATYALSAEELLLLNPNTGTLPIFANRIDAEITLGCYRRHPVLVRDGGANPWSLTFVRLFDMANDSNLFMAPDDLENAGAIYDGWSWRAPDRSWLPLYEAKMLTHWNNRLAGYANLPEGFLGTSIPRLTVDELDDPDADVLARYWVEKDVVLGAVPGWWERDWLFGWRDIARADDARTFVPSALPLSAVGDKFLLAFPLEPKHAPLLQSVWSSMAFDFVSRQKISGTGMKYFLVKQLACPTPATFDELVPWASTTLAEFVRPRVLELTYTNHRMAGYALDVLALPAGSAVGGPFRWLPERRAQLVAELDAAMMHVYGLSRAEAEHVLDSFPIVRRNEERAAGEYRTKRLVLDAYNALAGAAATGVPFASPLDPPPGDGPRHPERDR
ncbi:N-6 DNA methylase [Nocardioides sp. zg-1308]|uniref:Eco57I restriction-modification methylase domain-containing protein n=1 Tax=Nocardioides sp. zg-1308 TaxID=2736253 RepID=UPI001552119E|nr:N-6 DNA methylase [Nocardioides sp. zg-1308]NPD06526.1 N-6 DNA methylase [Nocardioides sp. zg-1308]